MPKSNKFISCISFRISKILAKALAIKHLVKEGVVLFEIGHFETHFLSYLLIMLVETGCTGLCFIPEAPTVCL